MRLLAPVLLLLASATAEVPVQANSVPEGTVTFEGHRYLVVDEVEDLSWTLGRDRCAAWGGTLAVITSEKEAAFVAQLADGRYLFLGATDVESEGEWIWVDGNPWRYSSWMEGQPNDYGGKEDYLATYDDGEWVDVGHEGDAFWMPTGFLCEWSD